MFYLHVCTQHCALDLQMSDPLELELEMAVSLYVGDRTWSSIRAASALSQLSKPKCLLLSCVFECVSLCVQMHVAHVCEMPV